MSSSIVVNEVSNSVSVNSIETSSVIAKEKGNTVVVTGVIGGVSLDANSVYTQSSPSATWVVNHNLNKYCSVTVVDSADNIVFGDVLYNSLNQVTLTFAGAFSGKAFFN
jgi:hypothetical protein